ncbi:MAG: RNA polymerase subunit sigma, partial [Bacteroidetes bacterium]|nr:RNA polymerase subunit sigma [Bacteroidota bacterium]
DIRYFYAYPGESWQVIKEIFFDFFGKSQPNAAHTGLAELEKMGLLKAVITQNIDNLHQEAGSRVVYEYHGNCRHLVCMECGKKYSQGELGLEKLPVTCRECNGLVKPDFIFFGEGIPEYAARKSREEALASDVFIVIGTTGEVMPACMLPHIAKQNGAKIIEINTAPSNFTGTVTDVFLQGKASGIMTALVDIVRKTGGGVKINTNK